MIEGGGIELTRCVDTTFDSLLNIKWLAIFQVSIYSLYQHKVGEFGGEF